MDILRIIAFILLVGAAVREIFYFKEHIVFTHKSVSECIIIVCGILVLIYITARYAVGWLNIAFGAVGIIAILAGWLKQGVSDKGVLTLNRGQSVFLWSDIDSVMIAEGEISEVRWLKQNGAVIAKQKYSQSALRNVREILQSSGIKEKI